MGFLSRLFSAESKSAGPPSKREECVLVHLDCSSLPDEVYRQCDVMTLSDRLSEILERSGLGESDGDEYRPAETTLFMYGPDAERLFEGIEAALKAYPLCQNARVVVRRGSPGAPEREIRLPRS
jgi:hypothetical protein